MSVLLRFSEAAGLAIHAALYLALHEERTVTCRELAAACAASEAHMIKVCQRLVKGGLLAARRGPRGGFSLARSASAIRMVDLFVTIEGPIQPMRCSFPDRACGDSHPQGCPVAAEIRRAETQFRGYLERTTLAAAVAGCRDRGIAPVRDGSGEGANA